MLIRDLTSRFNETTERTRTAIIADIKACKGHWISDRNVATEIENFADP